MPRNLGVYTYTRSSNVVVVVVVIITIFYGTGNREHRMRCAHPFICIYSSLEVAIAAIVQDFCRSLHCFAFHFISFRFACTQPIVRVCWTHTHTHSNVFLFLFSFAIYHGCLPASSLLLLLLLLLVETKGGRSHSLSLFKCHMHELLLKWSSSYVNWLANQK